MTVHANISGQPAGIAGAETLPPFGDSLGRELTGRLVPPLLAVLSVVAVWWLLYLIYPRLLPSPVSTVREAMRLVSPTGLFSSICIRAFAVSSSVRS